MLKKDRYTEVTGVICPECGDIIFSRAHRDFHYCSCGGIVVDGGFDYLRYGAMSDKVNFADIKQINITILADKRELYEDWNYSRNKYGTIKANNTLDQTQKGDGKHVLKIDSSDK